MSFDLDGRIRETFPEWVRRVELSTIEELLILLVHELRERRCDEAAYHVSVAWASITHPSKAC